MNFSVLYYIIRKYSNAINVFCPKNHIDIISANTRIFLDTFSHYHFPSSQTLIFYHNIKTQKTIPQHSINK